MFIEQSNLLNLPRKEVEFIQTYARLHILYTVRNAFVFNHFLLILILMNKILLKKFIYHSRHKKIVRKFF